MARASKNLVQTGVRLEPDTLRRLRSGRGLSDEIRERLERTFKLDEDPVTREVVEGLMNIAKLVALDFGAPWYADPKAHEAFVAAINVRLAAYAPSERTVAPAPPAHTAVVLGEVSGTVPDEFPKTIGRLREHDDRRQHAYSHLVEIVKRNLAGAKSATKTKEGGAS